MKVTAYTDGSSNVTVNNTEGDGSFVFVIVDNDEREIFRDGSYFRGTVSQCELLAALHAVKYCVARGYKEVEINSDSTYTVNSINKWIWGWSRNGWIKSNGDQVKNIDILQQFVDFKDKIKFTAKHVKGHNGNYYNELCDSIAKDIFYKRGLN